MVKRTKIVATLGPASQSERVIRAMIKNGVNVFRLNFSHGSHEYHRESLERVRRVAGELGVRVGILQDISGPKIRTGALAEPFELKKGDRIDFFKQNILGVRVAAGENGGDLADNGGENGENLAKNLAKNGGNFAQNGGENGENLAKNGGENGENVAKNPAKNDEKSAKNRAKPAQNAAPNPAADGSNSNLAPNGENSSAKSAPNGEKPSDKTAAHNAQNAQNAAHNAQNAAQNPAPAHYKLSINHPEILDLLSPGEQIFLYDGSIAVDVIANHGEWVETAVKNDGTLSSNKGVNFPNTKINIDVNTQKDRADLLWGVENGVDFLAISFVQNARDIDEVREILAARDAQIAIFAKIEKFDAVENIAEIINASDGIMVARGDLGIEVPYYRVPNIQKEIIRRANAAAKPVITATQMLLSLTKAKTATRAEISDVANAVLDGTDAVMLSEESAVGIDPANAVKVMSQTIIETEKRYPFNKFAEFVRCNDTDKIMSSTGVLAQDLGAEAIFALTSSGLSAIKMSRYRPSVPVIAVAHDERVLRGLCIVWGVEPAVLIDKATTLPSLMTNAVRAAVAARLMRREKCYVMTAGFPTGVRGTSNLVNVLKREQIEYYLGE